MAEKQAFVKLDNSQIDDEAFEDEDDRASYLYMELQSTSSFKDIDIDKMLEHTTLDDFMRGLYQSGADTQARGAAGGAKRDTGANVMGALMTGRGLEEMTEQRS